MNLQPADPTDGRTLAVMTETEAWSWPGVRVLVAGIGMVMLAGVLLGFGSAEGGWTTAGPITRLSVGIALLAVAIFDFYGLTSVVPGEARVVQLLGRYHGTLR